MKQFMLQLYENFCTIFFLIFTYPFIKYYLFFFAFEKLEKL